ncbi:cubilin [Trichonephila clavata]|uniref:Cubilin n=1 Tax=Trichonephila clavata TaxID=2740835 RepID=A0A8X6GHY0_TRICU|nr:cubilin [Trichonephila clavata]
MCIICHEVLVNDAMKPAKMLRHLKAKHSELEKKPREYFERRKQELGLQTKTFKQNFIHNKSLLKCSYLVALRIAKTRKSFTTGENLIKPVLIDVCLEMFGLSAVDKIKSIPLSNDTIRRRIEKLSENVEYQLIQKIKESTLFAIQIDESCDISKKAILICYVYGGENVQAPRLLNLCTHVTSPQLVVSHGNHMFIEFNSDHSVSRRGFSATFRRKAGGCGGVFKASESMIMSPNYPDPYNANDDCDWLIQVDPSHLIVLEFYEFDLPEAVNDTKGYVAVYDGNSTAAPLILKKSGQKPGGTFMSTGYQMLVKLVANGNDVGIGFKAHYKTGCGGRLLADEGGMISSPSYFSFVNCSWIIYAADPGDKVSLIVTHLHMPDYGNCSSSNLRILDGDMPDSPLIVQLCGFRIPPPILSRGNALHVMLQTGSFKATYGLASTHCGGVYHSTQGTFGSPGYPNNYDMDIECVWTIEAAVGNKVQLSFQDFNLEDSEYCNKDYVEVHENDESGQFIGRYCGSRVPINLTYAPKLWIKFRTDDVEMQKGFLAHFELHHYVTLNSTQGEIASPGFPNTYHDTTEYHWTVYVPSGMMISVRFLSISITTITDDYQGPCRVTIFDGMRNTDPPLGQFSGFQIPDPVVSTGNVIHIVFYTHHYYLGSFHLKWIAVTELGIVVDMPTPTDGYEPCWEEIQLNSTESMTVNSPNYPRNYPNNIKCTYIMRAPAHQHVELNITELNLEWRSEICSFDRVEIFYLENPNVDNWILNVTICDREENLFLVSPSNMLKLVFTTDAQMSYKGFTSIAKSRCGSRLGGPSGVLGTELFRTEISQMGVSQTVSCEYIITVKSRRTIQISFDRFYIPSDSSCSSNYIMVRVPPPSNRSLIPDLFVINQNI